MAHKSPLLGTDFTKDSTHGRTVAFPKSNVFEWVGSRVLQIFLFPALGGLLFGYDIGATSYVITQLKSSEYSGTTWHNDVDKSSILEGAITSAGTFS